MSVYNRRLFFNRGGYAHRGTGITSGLTPVQNFQTGGQVDPMDAYRQAVYSGMMSGKTKQGDIGGFLDVFGQATGAASDLLPKASDAKDDETYWAYNTATGTYDRVTDETFIPGTHTKDAPKEADPSKVEKKDFTEIKILKKDDKGGYTIEDTAYRFVDQQTETINHRDLKGNIIPAGEFIYAKDVELEKNKWKLDKDFNVKMIADGSEQTITRTWNAKDNQFKFLDAANNEIDGATFEYIDDPDKDIDAQWKKRRVDLVGKTEAFPDLQAVHSYNEKNKKFVYEDLEGNKIDMSNYLEAEEPETADGEASKPYVEGWIQFEGEEKPKKGDFIQDGNDVYYISQGENNTKVGEPILVPDLENVVPGTFDLIKTAPELTYAEQKQLLIDEANISNKYPMARGFLETMQQDAVGSRDKIKNNQILKQLIADSTSGSYASQRTAFMRLLKTIGYDKFAPDSYASISEVINAGGVPQTEAIDAFYKENVLGDALGWSQQLNRSELGLLFEKGPQIYLTKAGQNLLAETNVANAEIKQEVANFISDNLPEMDLLELHKQANEMADRLYKEYLERPDIVAAIAQVKGYENLGDSRFFHSVGSRTNQEGLTIDYGAAYDNQRVIFAGYPDPETGIYIDEAGNEHDFSAAKTQPIYYIIPTQEEWEDADNYNKNKNKPALVTQVSK